MFWNAVIDILLVVYVIDCLFMGLVIMMQRSKQEGLGAAFGGSFMSEFAGAQTSQVLVKATVTAAIIFFVLSISLARLYTNRAAETPDTSSVQQQLAVPVATPSSATNAAPAPVTAPAPTAPTPAASVTTPTIPKIPATTSTTTPPSKPASK